MSKFHSPLRRITSEQFIESADGNDQPEDNQAGSVNLGRHQAQFTLCGSEVREKVEEFFITWMSPGLIVDKFNNLSRDTIYLRADVFDLFNNRGGERHPAYREDN